MCDVCGHIENFFSQMIDAAEKTASAGDKNAAAQVTDKRFLIEPAFEELESFSQAEVNDRIQRLALDLLAGKTGIVFQ